MTNINGIIINFAPTGVLMQKKDTPFIPISPKEIIEDVRRAYEIGITSVHLHARDRTTGEPCWNKEVFEEIILGIREFAPDLIIAVTTSGRTYAEFSKRTDVLNLSSMAKPDMASLTLSSLNFNRTISRNEPKMIQNIVSKMNEKGIKPELELFDLGMINYAKYLTKKGMLHPPHYANIILGNIAGAQPTLSQSGALVVNLPEDTIFSMGAIGKFQLQTNAISIATGHGVRIGLEDNIWYDDERTKLASNEDYLTRIHQIMDLFGKELCSSSELRKKLNLEEGYGKYGTKTK